MEQLVTKIRVICNSFKIAIRNTCRQIRRILGDDNTKGQYYSLFQWCAREMMTQCNSCIHDIPICYSVKYLDNISQYLIQLSTSTIENATNQFHCSLVIYCSNNIQGRFSKVFKYRCKHLYIVHVN